MKYLLEKMLDEGMFDRTAAKVAGLFTRNDQIKSRLNLNVLRDKLEELRTRVINLRKAGKEAEANKLENKIRKLRKLWIDASNKVKSSDTKDDVKSRLIKTVADDKAVSRTKLAKKGMIGTGAAGVSAVTAVGINKNKKAKQNQEKEVVNENYKNLAIIGGGLIVTSALVDYITKLVYSKVFNSKVKECMKIKDTTEKFSCKANAYKKYADALRTSTGECSKAKNPEKCKAAINKLADKYEYLAEEMDKYSKESTGGRFLTKYIKAGITKPVQPRYF